MQEIYQTEVTYEEEIPEDYDELSMGPYIDLK